MATRGEKARERGKKGEREREGSRLKRGDREKEMQKGGREGWYVHGYRVVFPYSLQTPFSTVYPSSQELQFKPV